MLLTLCLCQCPAYEIQCSAATLALCVSSAAGAGGWGRGTNFMNTDQVFDLYWEKKWHCTKSKLCLSAPRAAHKTQWFLQKSFNCTVQRVQRNPYLKKHPIPFVMFFTMSFSSSNKHCQCIEADCLYCRSHTMLTYAASVARLFSSLKEWA